MRGKRIEKARRDSAKEIKRELDFELIDGQIPLDEEEKEGLIGNHFIG